MTFALKEAFPASKLLFRMGTQKFIPSHFRSSFWMDCSHGDGTIASRFLFCSHWNAFIPLQVSDISFHSFLQQQHPCVRLGQKVIVPFFWTSSAPHCLFKRERNETIAYRSAFQITCFIDPLLGTERYSEDCVPV